MKIANLQSGNIPTGNKNVHVIRDGPYSRMD